MSTTATTRRLIPGLALVAASVLLVACGSGVVGTAAPGSAAAGSPAPSSERSSSVVDPPSSPPAVTISTVSDLPTTGSELPATTVPSVSVPSVSVPSVSVPPVPTPTVPVVPVQSVPVVPVPSVVVPTAPTPPVPDSRPEPQPAGEPSPVDPELYWAPAVDAYAWTSPSGNILCLLQPEEATVGCAAFEHSITPAAGCWPDQPFVAELGPGGVIQGCTGDVPYSGEVLAYGESISVGGLTCSSSAEGMVCDDGDVAFLLSRDGLELAG